jgi:N-acetylglucosamine-6-sulfatase
MIRAAVHPYMAGAAALAQASSEKSVNVKRRPRNAISALLCLGIIVPLLAGLISVGVARGQPLSSRPNIIVIMADDLDLRSLEAALTNNLMPHLRDNIVSNAYSFRNSFVTNSLCCPSRATFLTGQYSHNHGTLTNFMPTGGVVAFDDRSTLATWLQDGGYRTGYVGKYLNGYGWFHDLNRDGLINGQDLLYIPPGWEDWQALLDLSTYQVYGYSINDNGTRVRYGFTAQDYQTDVLAGRAVDFIRESAVAGATAPFFLYIAPLAPHDEISLFTPSKQYSDVWRWTIRPAPRHMWSVNQTLSRLPSFNEADLSDKPQWVQNWPFITSTDLFYLQRKERYRLAALRSVDDLIGSVAAALRETNRLDNTVLMFTSDNGWSLGEHRIGGKMSAYEEAIRVPLYIRLPGASTGRTLEQFVLNNDLAPTIADLAQVSPELAIDGCSLIPLMNGAAPAWRQRFLVEHFQANSHITEIPTYAAIRTTASDPTTPNQLYLEYQDEAGSSEFYDLSVDPYQLTSLHADSSPQRITQRSVHAARLSALQTCGDGTCQALESE